MSDKDQLHWTFHLDVISKSISVLEDALKGTELTQYHKAEIPLALEEIHAALAALRAQFQGLENKEPSAPRLKQSA